MAPPQGQGANLPQAAAGQLVREPLMLTLPLAYGITRVISEGLGGAAWSVWIGALVVSILVYILDWYASSTPETPWRSRDFFGRFAYVILNTLILVGILTGLVELTEPPPTEPPTEPQ
jgi:O-antigen/teichoic acid export membrane protein